MWLSIISLHSTARWRWRGEGPTTTEGRKEGRAHHRRPSPSPSSLLSRVLSLHRQLISKHKDDLPVPLISRFFYLELEAEEDVGGKEREDGSSEVSSSLSRFFSSPFIFFSPKSRSEETFLPLYVTPRHIFLYLRCDWLIPARSVQRYRPSDPRGLLSLPLQRLETSSPALPNQHTQK